MMGLLTDKTNSSPSFKKEVGNKMGDKIKEDEIGGA
jgi:hypothetical protein